MSLPPAWFFKVPPSPLPQTLPAPSSDFTYAPAFDIPPALYKHLLHPAYPISIAIVYALAATYLNQVNHQRGKNPWALSKTPVFFAVVLAHNIFLAAYSAWTFVGMVQAVRHTWTGWHSGHGLAGATDALCKIHGPRNYGQAVLYNATTSAWRTTSEEVNLSTSGTPDPTDVGRLWNEGLAFYGWLFYLSKFYEVVDTFVILAKGKTSSFLQTYHHAGAMLCVWAGIRYMSPPIWMFVTVNAGIHTLMYTYYALTSLSVPIPTAFKRTLTTLQIVQFVIGASYAALHLFISYKLPVRIPYTVISSYASSAGASVSSAAHTATKAAASAGVGQMLKRLALRAAGEEGLAENVRRAEPGGRSSILSGAAEKMREEIRYRTEYETVRCIDTSGQAFAIWLNVLYLAPLTYLFVNFFIRSYLRRTSPSTKPTTKLMAAENAGKDALKGVERKMDEVPAEKNEADGKKAKKGGK
ncbi:MAG: hypothetical protein M1817_001102 [Caeruleum heppii]|nr:MAG: hypothetical protein M1817_001102 [Caeruleum heppii]